MPLHSDIEEFRKSAHEAVDWMADYLSNSERYPVVARVKPGEIAAQFAAQAPNGPTPLAALFEEFQQKIVPGITHWNHPGFLAYFSITGSPAGVLGEMLAAALNVNGMLWKTSPAVTELETVVLNWLRDAMGLPESFFGIINDTASINSFLALAAAREATGLAIREEGMSGRDLPQLRVYCSEQAHSSIEKGALALGFGVKGIRKISTDANFAMNVDELRKAVIEDRMNDVVPVAIVAAVGTDSSQHQRTSGSTSTPLMVAAP
jgi:aromatic-L-amino-acid/L-tryptophan decarboxylase